MITVDTFSATFDWTYSTLGLNGSFYKRRDFPLFQRNPCRLNMMKSTQNDVILNAFSRKDLGNRKRYTQRTIRIHLNEFEDNKSSSLVFQDWNHSFNVFFYLKKYVHSDLGTRLSCHVSAAFSSFTICPKFFTKLTMSRAGGTTHDLQGRGLGISYIWAMKRGTCVELRGKLYQYTNISSYVRIVGKQLWPINIWQGLWFSTRKSWWFHVRVIFRAGKFGGSKFSIPKIDGWTWI